MAAPAFRFYPGDFMSSPSVQLMELHEKGAYVLLLCVAWQQQRHGFLPDDEDMIRRWAMMTREQWAQSKTILLERFPVVEPGWRANARMVREAEKQKAYSLAQSKKGSKGGRPKKSEKLVVSEKNPELSSSFHEESSSFTEDKPKDGSLLASGLGPEKLSVSVSVSASGSASKKDISAPAEPHPDASHQGSAIREVVERVFAHYVRTLGRAATYTLTHARRQKAEARLRERLRSVSLEEAEGECMRCVANLAASEFHRANGHIDWNDQIFKSQDEFEKRLNWQPPRSANADRGGATVGAYQPCDAEKGEADADAAEKQLRQEAKDYWRRMRDKGERIYDREAPPWVRRELEAEKGTEVAA